MSRRASILAAIVSRLEAITLANGFETDAGSTLFLNETPQLGPDDPAHAIAVVIQDDEIRMQQPGKKLLIVLPLSVQALAKADLAAPWMAVEAVLGDIKKAMELDDLTLGGLVEQYLARGATRTIPREPGGTTVGASILYGVQYSEQWGNP